MSVTLDVHYERDAVARRQRRLQLMLITIEPVGSSGDTADAHAGEDAGTVLEGVLHLGVDGETGVLSIRDSLLFASTLPHRFANGGSIRCLVLWAVTLFVLGQRGMILLRGQASAGRNVAAREGAF